MKGTVDPCDYVRGLNSTVQSACLAMSMELRLIVYICIMNRINAQV